jgi:hypothetical protein
MAVIVTGQMRFEKSTVYGVCLCLAVVLTGALYPIPGHAAACNGADIDGELLNATAYSYDTANYYYVRVRFSGDEVIIYFRNGGYRRLTLDDEEIDDPTSISAYDYDRSTYWDIDIGECP